MLKNLAWELQFVNWRAVFSSALLGSFAVITAGIFLF